MHYVNDSKGIRDAKDKVDDAKLEIEIANKEKQIALIEKEIDLLNEKKDAINEQIDILDEQIDQINEFYDAQIKAIDKQIESIDRQIEGIQKQKEETEKYYESMIEGLEKSKSKYEELTELIKKAELSAALQKLGIDEEALLNGSEEEFEKLKNAYLDVVFKLNEGNNEVLSALQELSGYSGTAPVILEESNGKLDEMNGKLDTSNQSIGTVNSSLTETAATTSNVAANVSDLNAGLSEVSTIVTDEQAAFDGLKLKIDEVITAINDKITAIQEEQSAVNTATSDEMVNFLLLKDKILEVKESIDSVNTTVSTLDTEAVNELTTAFQLLYDQLVLVSDTLGAGMEDAEGSTLGGIASAIQALNDISLEDGIIAQFINLKTSIDEVASAISGGGTSGSSLGSEGSGSGSGSKSGGAKTGSKGSEDEGSSGSSLTGAITEMGETAKEVIGEPGAEGDGTVIGEFGSMKTVVNDVTEAIGSSDPEGGKGENSGSGQSGDSGNLIDSIVSLGETSEETLGEPGGDGVIGRFEEFKDVIEEAANQVKSISDGLDEIDGKEVECKITVNVEMNGSIPEFASGTVLDNMKIESATYNAQYGKAFASGTIGLKRDEKNALRSEYGQPELTVYPNGTTELTTSPVMSSLPKGTVIYNEEQTKKIMDNKANPAGNAHADGTDDEVIVLPNGMKLRPVPLDDKIYDFSRKWEAYMAKIGNNVNIITNSGLFKHNQQMDEIVKHVTNNVNNISNNNKPNISIGDINVTCPGVTSQEVVKEVGDALSKQIGHLALRAMQEPLNNY